MATGKDKQITRQTGESSVMTELGRRGFIATTFSANIPDFDIMAKSPSGNRIEIQVKAIRGPSWQFRITDFLDVELQGDIQVVKGKKSSSKVDLLCIFVHINPSPPDDFFIFRWGELQDIFFSTYKGGRRPRKPDSFHCALGPRELAHTRDRWDLLGA